MSTLPSSLSHWILTFLWNTKYWLQLILKEPKRFSICFLPGCLSTTALAVTPPPVTPSSCQNHPAKSDSLCPNQPHTWQDPQPGLSPTAPHRPGFQPRCDKKDHLPWCTDRLLVPSQKRYFLARMTAAEVSWNSSSTDFHILLLTVTSLTSTRTLMG